MEHELSLSLSKSEALVLFEWLARLEKSEVKFEHAAEEIVLWRLEAQLEKTLIEPFSPEYERLLARARKQVADESGDAR